VIRVALGEVSYVGYANPDNFSYPEIMIAVLSTMLAEWRPGPDEIGEVFEKASILLAERMAQVPELAEAERLWFAAKMPESPFAWLSGARGPREGRPDAQTAGQTSEEARGTANGSRTLPSGGLARPKRAGQLPDRPTQWRAGWLE